MIGAYQNHWFSLIRPAIKPLLLRYVTGIGRLTSHKESQENSSNMKITDCIIHPKLYIPPVQKKTSTNINIIIYISCTIVIVYDMIILYHNKNNHNKYIRIHECDMWILTNYICDCHCQGSIIYINLYDSPIVCYSIYI